MNKKDKEILRAFYQGLATPEERKAYLAVMGMGKMDKARLLIDLGKKYGVTPEIENAVFAATALTKADRIAIASNWFRNLIFSLFGR